MELLTFAACSASQQCMYNVALFSRRMIKNDFKHSVRQLQQPPAQQYFSLTPLQHQLPATSQPTIFFSHITPATSSNSNPANRVILSPYTWHATSAKTNRNGRKRQACAALGWALSPHTGSEDVRIKINSLAACT